MTKEQRKVKEGFWIALAFVVIIAFALISNWWTENTVIAWVIFGLVIVGFGYSVYRFPSFRKFIFKTAKRTGEKIVFEEEASSREPVPTRTRQNVLSRANNRCENQDCRQVVKPHIHHIDGDNNNNNYRNLIALCPNCHSKAGNGVFTTSQLRNWVNFSWERHKRNQRTRR